MRMRGVEEEAGSARHRFPEPRVRSSELRVTATPPPPGAAHARTRTPPRRRSYRPRSPADALERFANLLGRQGGHRPLRLRHQKSSVVDQPHWCGNGLDLDPAVTE